MEVDVTKYTKVCKHTEGTAAAEGVISGDNSSAHDTDPIRLASFGEGSTGPPALPCSSDDALVDDGVVPESCLSPAEIRTRTVPGALLAAGTASTTMRGSTIGEGGDTTILPPERSPKQPLLGIGLYDRLHDWQACPEFIAFHQGDGKICSR